MLRTTTTIIAGRGGLLPPTFLDIFACNMAPPRDQQSNRRAVRLSGRTSEEGSSRSPTSKRSREEDKDEDQHVGKGGS